MNVLTQWRRFWRLAEIRLLLLALVVAVVAVTSVGFFTDRADRAMSAQATQLLGGDIVIVSTRKMDRAYLDEAKKRGLRTAETISFPSMVSSGEAFQLAEIKAVSENYPLHGEIETQLEIGGAVSITPITALKEQETLAEPRLFSSLAVSAGKTVQLGRSEVILSKMIAKMPDQASNAFQLAPHLVLPMKDLAATGLLSPASRASYRYLFAGDEKQVALFKAWIKPKLKQQESLRTLEDGLPSVQQALQRGQRFLKMASLLAVILAGAGIALSSFSLTQRETSSVAVLKTLGASRGQVLGRYLSQLLLSATVAAMIGSVIGYFVQQLLAQYLQGFVGQTLPNAGWQPVAIGFLTSWIMVLGFSAPQLLQLVTISPIQILQGQINRAKTPLFFTVIILSAAVLLLMWLQTQDMTLSLMLMGAVLIALLIFWIMATLLLRVIRLMAHRWRLPKANKSMAMMVVVFGIGLFSLLLLTTLRSDLIHRWQSSLPVDAPNHFLINIQPNEVKPLQALLAKDHIETPLYPMTLGRLVAVNQNTISADAIRFADNHRARRLLRREFNLSATPQMPEGNRVVEGQWFAKGEQTGFSVEEGIAKTLGLKMGDRLTFDIAGQKLEEKITSLRFVQWDSMKPNFFVLTAPQALDDKPRTFITSIHVAKEKKDVLPRLIRQYPSVTDIDISAILEQVKDLINKAALAVQAIFIFTLLSGIVVLFSALQSQKALRRKEIAIFKSLGASRAYLRRNLLLEFIMIGGIAGFIAALLAVIAGNIAAYTLFDLRPDINIRLIVLGTVLGAALVGLAGYFNVRNLLKVLPVALFR